MLTFRQLQEEHREWAYRNFGGNINPALSLLGVMEELGELAHAHLKGVQHIRGTTEEHNAAAKDAIGDCIIFLSDYTSRRGWDLQAIVEETWAQVRQRDWRRDALNGQPASPAPAPEEVEPSGKFSPEANDA